MRIYATSHAYSCWMPRRRQAAPVCNSHEQTRDGVAIVLAQLPAQDPRMHHEMHWQRMGKVNPMTDGFGGLVGPKAALLCMHA